METRRDAQTWRPRHGLRLEGSRGSSARRRARDHFQGRSQDDGRAARRNRRTLMTPVVKTRAATAALLVALVLGVASAQKSAAKIPRMADGKPDLSGVWITGALQLLIGEEEARA